MKTQIVVVDALAHSYSDSELRSHFRSLHKLCKGKRTGMVFSEVDLLTFESSYYWQNLEEKVLNFSDTVDFTQHMKKALELDEKALLSPSLMSKRHFEAQAHFMRLVGDVRSLQEEISDKEFEIVVMDFYKGFFLQQLYPDNFSLSFQGRASVEHEDAYKQLSEFRMLRRISPFSESYIDGTWDVDDPPMGTFEIHFVEEPRVGLVQGLIPDVRGLALFSGQIYRNSLEFKKLYFLDSVKNDRAYKGKLTKAPINYALYAGFRDGHYWWGDKETNCNFCACTVKQKIGYP